jgi:MFS transporter, PAT family, beta-lactamase induction signal transducer AmpG
MNRLIQPRLYPHPIVFTALIVPFGAVGGYLTVALAYTLSQAGLPVARLGLLIAIYYMPQTWKFLWAPIVDTTLTRKTWYLIGSFFSILGVVAMAACSTRATLFGVLASVAVIASFAVTFLGMSVESLAAYGTSAQHKGRTGGWLQAGSLGGSGIGGGAALWLSQQTHFAWIPGVALGACFALCCLALLFVTEPLPSSRESSVSGRVIGVVKDLWQVARSRGGYLALLIVFLPIGSGAAANFFSAAADDWHASAQTVALINGALGGLVSAAGCIAGGYLCDRFNRKTAYIAYGLLLSCCALAMAVSAHTASSYVIGTASYAFITGLCFAAFSAVTFEAIGHGAAATKYNLFASLSNMPIAYLTAIEGWAHTPWGINGFLYVDAVLGALGALLFCAVAFLTARRFVPLEAQSL